jgi:hypothetical protein
MYVFLLALGAVITATGVALLGSGVSIQEHTFDPTTVTPGAVAAIGGLIVIGLGLAVRVLERIEQALVARPMPRAAEPAAAASATRERSDEPVTIPFQAKPKTEPQEIAPPAAVSTPAPAAVTLEQFREKFPTVVRLEDALVVAENEVSLMPRPPGQSEEQLGEVSNGRVTSGVNGSGSPVRIVPPDEAAVPSGAAADRRKVSMFEALWPKGPRAGRQAQTAVASVAVPAEQPAEPRTNVQPAPMPAQAPMPVSILKSGVVDGMAYTLYSDGSIEAQLPQGTLRFGSITELRNHIEQSA